MGIVTENKVRHIPILENGKSVGLVSIGYDVLGPVRTRNRLSPELTVAMMAAKAVHWMTRGLGYLSEINPAGEKSSMNGNRINALTIAVSTICSWPS